METLTQRIPQDLAQSKFTSSHWPLGSYSCSKPNIPYQLPLLGTGTSTEYSAQARHSFPLLLKDGNATPQPTTTLGKITGTSEKHMSSGWETTENAQVPFQPRTLLLPSSQPTSWPPARGSCRDITPWPSTSSTPGDAGCEEQSVTGLSTTSLPSTTSLSPTGTGTLPALPENTSQKASRFTRAPREGEQPPRQVSGPSAFLPVLHLAPAPRSPPRSAPRTTPRAGKAGRGNCDFKGH